MDKLIHRAAYHGNLTEVDRLIAEDGARLYAQLPAGAEAGYRRPGWAVGEKVDVGGCTPLMLAALGGHDAVVARLLALGATGQGAAVTWACTADASSTMALLLDSSHSINEPYGFWMKTPLMEALRLGAVECIKLLLARGRGTLDLDVQDRLGRAALHHAVTSTQKEFVDVLLAAGADPTIRDFNGHTPLDHARDWAFDFPTQFQRPCSILQAALAEPQRPRLLLKARRLLDAAHAVHKARTDARSKEGLDTVGQQIKAVMAAPTYLKQRVAWSQPLPRVEIERENDDEQLVACIKYALGLESGGAVVVEGVEPGVGMRKEVFVELCEMMVPKWDRKNV